MASITDLLAQLEAAASGADPQWLRERMAGILRAAEAPGVRDEPMEEGELSEGFAAPGPSLPVSPAGGECRLRRSQRIRVPSRESLEVTLHPRSQRRSPMRGPPVQAQQHSLSPQSVRTGRSPSACLGEVVAAAAETHSSNRVRPRAGDERRAADPHRRVAGRGEARGERNQAPAQHHQQPLGGRSKQSKRSRGRGGRRRAAQRAEMAQTAVQATSYGADASNSDADAVSQASFRGAVERADGTSEEDDRDDRGDAAGGPFRSAQLGELVYNLHPGVPVGGGQRKRKKGEGADSNTLNEMLVCLKELVGRREPAVASPVVAWAGTSVGASQSEQGSTSSAGVTVSSQTEGEKEVEPVRIDDKARGEVYVCFEGPLGAHLKKEVREKIWRDEYVEIFSLLPLAKFNLDKIKNWEYKKEEEERRRYRLIPQTFDNWMQAFAIMATVIVEKTPEHCAGLFCYLDAIGEAHRVYGGQTWLRYDEQFRQRREVRPAIRWDQKDIALWLKLTAGGKESKEIGGQSFHGRAGTPGQSAGGAAGGSAKGGICWQYNEGACKYGGGCKFKHTCSFCGGGSHGAARCFKRGRGRGAMGVGQGKNTCESGGDVAFPRQVSR